MNKNLEFVTSKNQYLFNFLLNNIQLTFFGGLATAASSVFFANEGNSFSMTTAFVSLFFMIFTMCIGSILYINIKFCWFKSELPKIIISDDGLSLYEFGKIKKITWSDITKVEVTGRFRKIITLSDLKPSHLYEIEYYLFSPEQRRKIIPAIAAKINVA